MTREEIEKLEGVALDEAVAEHRMGWIRHDPTASFPWESPDRPHPPGTAIMRHHLRVPPYSTSIAAAWQVVEKFNGDFEVRHQNGLIYRATAFIPSREFECWAATAPLAICRCALIATFDAATPAPAAGRGTR